MIVYPWVMIGEYEDDKRIYARGFSEDECMCKLIGLQEKHGKLIWYSGLCNDDYMYGEYIGRENLIYD